MSNVIHNHYYQTQTQPPVYQSPGAQMPIRTSTHDVTVGYLFWLIGFTGAHRFYYGKVLTGIIWFLTLGLFGIGWIVVAFLIPSVQREANKEFAPGQNDYSVSWALLVFLGIFGVHRFYLGKFVTGTLFLLTGGLFGIGFVYDLLTLNDQIHDLNRTEVY